MKIKDGFVLRTIAGTTIVVPVGERVSDFNDMLTLNDISVKIWEYLHEDRTFDELLDYITSVYDIDEEHAANDLKNLLTKMVSCGVLEK